MFGNMPLWKEAPFLRVTIPFIGGIWLQRFCSGPLWLGLMFLAFAACTLIVFEYVSTSQAFRYSGLRGTVLVLLLVSGGYCIAEVKSPFKARDDLDAILPYADSYRVTITEPPRKKSKSWKCSATIDTVMTGSLVSAPGTGIILYIKRGDSLPVELQYGSRLEFTKKPAPVRNTGPPGSFDYVEYCALKNIHHQVYLTAGEYVSASGNGGSRLMSILYQIQDEIVHLLKKYIPGEKEAGLALALLIGYKYELDRSITQAYSNTGVVHVIAISGLHLGIIYLILQMLCRPLRGLSGGALLSSLIVCTGLWLFALLAGAGASVMRSAVMFTCLSFGKTAGRSTLLLNNLAASAFLLLCYDPYWLWDAGFILSYSALAGIAFYAKPLEQVCPTDNGIMTMIWKMNSVTLAAQIPTVPVIIYNFHQFPNLFLITNFIAVPASTLILVGEIILCATWFAPGCSEVLGYSISYLIRLLNSCIIYFNNLPFSTTNLTGVSLIDVIFLYAFILFFSLFISLKNKRLLYLSIMCLIAIFADGVRKIWQ